jgi:hypothetical protein
MSYFDDTDFDSIPDMMDAVAEAVERTIMSLATAVESKQLGLDERAGYRIMVTEDAIIVPASARRSLDYYGGFEYVDEHCVNVVGDYVIYSAEDERVQGHLDHFFHPSVDEDHNDPMDDFNYVGHPAHY